MNSSSQPLDEEAVHQLAQTFLVSIREHYHNRPRTRATAQEALNALASVAAMIIVATDQHDEAAMFFDQAFAQQMTAELVGRHADDD
jgi:siroheme synthase (precorrin-2 oxidase/ferrochelatase)